MQIFLLKPMKVHRRPAIQRASHGRHPAGAGACTLEGSCSLWGSTTGSGSWWELGLWGGVHSGSFLIRAVNLWESHTWARERCVEQGAQRGAVMDWQFFSPTLCTAEGETIGIRNGQWTWAWEKKTATKQNKTTNFTKVIQILSFRYYLIQCIIPMFREIKFSFK